MAGDAISTSAGCNSCRSGRPVSRWAWPARFIFSPGLWVTAALAVVLAASFPDAATQLPLFALSGVTLVLLCAITGQLDRDGCRPAGPATSRS